MTEQKFKKLVEETLHVLEGYEVDKKGNKKMHIVGIEKLYKQLNLPVVVKSLPTEQCVRDWYKEEDIDDNFWKHSTEWSNEDVFKEVYKALKYFINRWQ